jgi:hypothetical protein
MYCSTRTGIVGALSGSKGAGTLNKAPLGIAMLGIIAVAVACHSPVESTRIPPPSPSGAVTLAITGPTNVAPGQTVGYTATARGSGVDYTQKVVWSASPTSVLTISPTGQATGQAAGDANVQTALSSSAGCCSATKAVLVLPPNTYRLIGRVLESGTPVTGGLVVVLSGIGAGMSARTDASGGYRLYGVAGPIQVKFSEAGYDDIVKTFTATQNDVLDFPEAHQTEIPSLGGAYTLTVTADPACPVTSTGTGSAAVAPLEDALRSPRNYAASLAQDGPTLTVTLTDPAIIPTENHFTGRVTPDTLEFQINDGYYYVGVTEQLSSSLVLSLAGHAQVQRSTSTGPLNGIFEEFDTASRRVVEQCVSANHRFTLARAAQPARHR